MTTRPIVLHSKLYIYIPSRLQDLPSSLKVKIRILSFKNFTKRDLFSHFSHLQLEQTAYLRKKLSYTEDFQTLCKLTLKKDYFFTNYKNFSNFLPTSSTNCIKSSPFYKFSQLYFSLTNTSKQISVP